MSFLKRTLTVVAGKGAANVITFVLTPVIARFFGPEHFGVVAVFVSTISIVSVLSSLRYEFAIPLPLEDRNALGILLLSAILLIGTSLAVTTAIGGVYLLELDRVPWQSVGPWIWALPGSLLLIGSLNIVESWLVRKKQFKVAAYSDVLQAGTISGTRVILGWFFGSSVWALIFAYILGLIAKLAALLGMSRVLSLVFPPVKEREKSLRSLAREYSDFPIYNAPAEFVRMFSQNIPVLMFGFLFTPYVAGLYAMANRLLQTPVSMVGVSVRRVFLQHAAERLNTGQQIHATIKKITTILAVVSLPPAALVYIFGGEIVEWFLGPGWVDAGIYVEILVPWLYTMVLTIPVTAVVVVLRRQALWLKVQILILLARLSIFLGGYAAGWTPVSTLEAFVIASAIMNLMIVVLSFQLSKNSVEDITSAKSVG